MDSAVVTYALFGLIVALFIYAVAIFTNKDVYYWIKYCKVLYLIHFYRQKHTKKLPTYENLHKTTAFNIGIFPYKSEYEIENPRSSCNKQLREGIHFFGVDNKQNLIDICIQKTEQEQASVWIYFKLNNGDSFILPNTLDTRAPYIDNDLHFYSNGLQIKCLVPFRKWRISFNGLLRKCQKSGRDESEQKELIHAKFSFVWLAMSCAQEKNTDFSNGEIAKAIAIAAKNIDSFNLECVYKILNRYDQWGQLMGTLSTDKNKEVELYLWTCRTRLMDSSSDISADAMQASFFMYFKEGYPLKFEVLSVKDLFQNYINGYKVGGTGGIQNISKCDYKLDASVQEIQKLSFSFILKKEKIRLELEFKEKITFHVGATLENSLLLRTFKVLLDNGDEGNGILHLQMRRDHPMEEIVNTPPLLLREQKYISSEKSIILLNDDHCKNSSISGGKGCSLALLTTLSNVTQKFDVPKGFVITTCAFENHVRSHSEISLAIQQVVKAAARNNSSDLKRECSNCIEEFLSHNLTEKLKDEIKEVLFDLYESLEKVKFSIRSSAQGEDSEDLSAAGQMLTVLGVRGISNILDGVVKCWSSKFSFEAVEYSRQNGQSIRLPMAVVVQEMVPSEVAGVMFTVDPVTGNPLYPCITANYGLGESVVSSVVEPDTITLERQEDNSVKIYHKIVGSKKKQICMTGSGGTEEKSLDASQSKCCLSDDWSENIGSIGILIESCFCSPRDIEWAIAGNKLYLLQARPVTTLHTETDFELMHDQDTPMSSEDEYWTRANTGEVFLGAASPLGISLIVGWMDILSHRNQILREKESLRTFCPYFAHVLPVCFKQVTLSIIDTLYRVNGKEITSGQKAFEVAIFGRVIGTEEMHRRGVKKYGQALSWKKQIHFPLLLFYSFKLPGILKKIDDKVKKFKIQTDIVATPLNIWKSIFDTLDLYHEVCDAHGFATFLSSFYNFMVISILAKKKKDWDSDLYLDFASVLSTCSGVESADVPESLHELGRTIAQQHGPTFVSLTSNMAYNALKNDKGSSGELFREFLNKHGHRCIKEFDPYSISWGMNPETLIPILQNLVSSPNIMDIRTKDEITVEKIISGLKTPVQGWSKKILEIVLPWSRQGVRDREHTKSLLIRVVEWYRHTFYHLGEQMVQEGMLPSKELVFFLTMEEIQEVIVTRRPGLVQKAVRRKKLHTILDRMQFPEIIKGIPKPINDNVQEDLSQYAESFTLSGFPVCHGKVKAIVRVVMSLEDANTIQNGDILVTHSTDIGWSPYFPLLSGVVTVLGGLISHGAVVAREYGLPCIVGVEKALSAFKSGDHVILDGSKGTITKIAINLESEV